MSNPTYSLINNETGEVTDLDTMVDPKKMKWQKVWAKNLASMLEITGDEKTKVIAYLIKKKDYENRIMATMRTIAADVGVSTKTVNTTMKILQENNYLHKVQNGVWRFSPHVMNAGSHGLGMAVVTMYDNESKTCL